MTKAGKQYACHDRFKILSILKFLQKQENKNEFVPFFIPFVVPFRF